ncbi:MAG: tetratricopeptide repeat protein [Planctomycetota bacterium]
MMILTAMCALLMQDPGAGLQQFRDGDYAAAAKTFEAAVEQQPQSPELLYNLAVARWHAGELDAAEDAAGRYAAAPGGGRADLYHGLRGNIRFERAKQLGQRGVAALGGAIGSALTGAEQAEDPTTLFRNAIEQAMKARDEFVRAASVPDAAPSVLRNAERALRQLEWLEKLLEEAKKQQQEQKSDQQGGEGDEPNDEKGEKGDEKSDENGDPQDDDQQPGEDGKDDPQDGKDGDRDQDQQSAEDGQQPDAEPQDGDDAERPEPSAEEQHPEGAGEPEGEAEDEQAPEPQPQEPDEKSPAEQAPRTDAPGEVGEGKELSPEQQQRLLEQLKQLDGELRRIRARARGGKRPVERDW